MGLNAQLLRRIFKQLIPPILLLMLPAKLKNHQKSDITYEGVYGSFEEVIAKYGPQSDYSTDIAHEESVSKTHRLIANTNSFGFIPSWSTHRMNIISSYISGFEKVSIKVLDIGGGFAETYLYIKSSNTLRLDYRIIELVPTVRACNEIFKDYSDLKFYVGLEDLEFHPDIIYFGSSIQYFEDWRKVLNYAISYNPNTIMITDTPMGNVQTFVAAQVNMPGIVIPRYIFNIGEIKELLLSQDYYLVNETSIFYPFHNFANYSFEYQGITHMNLIFRKKDGTI